MRVSRPSSLGFREPLSLGLTRTKARLQPPRLGVRWVEECDVCSELYRDNDQLFFLEGNSYLFKNEKFSQNVRFFKLIMPFLDLVNAQEHKKVELSRQRAGQNKRLPRAAPTPAPRGPRTPGEQAAGHPGGRGSCRSWSCRHRTVPFPAQPQYCPTTGSPCRLSLASGKA